MRLSPDEISVLTEYGYNVTYEQTQFNLHTLYMKENFSIAKTIAWELLQSAFKPAHYPHCPDVWLC